MTDEPKVLVVDEDAQRLAAIGDALASRCRLTLLEDSDRCLECFEAEPPELMLVGLELERDDGLTLCRRLRELDPERHCKILLLVPEGFEDGAESWVDAGADDFALVPIDADELVTKVGIWSRVRRCEREHIGSDAVLAGVLAAFDEVSAELEELKGVAGQAESLNELRELESILSGLRAKVDAVRRLRRPSATTRRSSSAS